jgi:PAS domain S-box-containing protein
VTHASDAIIAKTLDSIVTSWNTGATQLLGYRAEEMIGRSIARIIPPERINEED